MFASSPNDVVIIGLDDGNAQHKCTTDTSKFKFLSHVQRGQSNIADIGASEISDSQNKNGEAETFTYTTKTNMTYVVGDEIDQPISRNDEFAFNEPAQVLLQHALHKVEPSLTNRQFVLCTSMPLRSFFKSDGNLNQDNISRKMESVKASFEILTNENNQQNLSKNILYTLVQPEAVCAFYSYYYDLSGNEPKVSNEYYNKTVAIADPGGKTTDIAVMKNMNINMDKSSTRDIGFNQLIKRAKDYIYDQGILNPTETMARKLISEGVVVVRGQPTQHKQWQTAQRKQMAEDIVDQIVDAIGNGLSIDVLMLIGGTVKALEPELRPILDKKFGANAYIIPNDPDYANARGLHVFAKLWFAKQSRSA